MENRKWAFMTGREREKNDAEAQRAQRLAEEEGSLGDRFVTKRVRFVASNNIFFTGRNRVSALE